MRDAITERIFGRLFIVTGSELSFIIYYCISRKYFYWRFSYILVYDVKNVLWHLVTLPVFIGARQHAIIKRYQMLIFDCLPIVQMAIRPKGIADSRKICVVKQTHLPCFTPYVPHCHGIPIDINKNRHCGLTIENSKQWFCARINAKNGKNYNNCR